MVKEPARRYQSAGDLAADLRRFLAGQPILARRTGLAERAWRWARRNPALASLSTAVVLLVAALTALAIGKWRMSNALQLQRMELRPIDKPSSAADELLKVVADLDRTEPGWRYEGLEAARKVIPEDQNGALQIMLFRKTVAVQTGRPQSEGDWLQSSLVERLRTLSDLPPRTPISDADAQVFRAELQRLGPVLLQARKMVDYPEGRFPIATTRDFISVALPDHQAVRQLVKLLDLDAIVNLWDGRRAQALADVRAALNCGACFKGEPVPVTQLIRIAISGVATRMLERTLAQGTDSEEILAGIQRGIEAEVDDGVFLLIAKGERAAEHYYLGSLAAGDASIKSLEGYGIKVSPSDVPPDAIQRNHRWALEHLTKLVQLAGRPSHEWQSGAQRLEEEQSHSAFAEGGLARSLQKLVPPEVCAEAALRRLAHFRAMIVALSAERYRLKHHDWPRDPNGLVPDFLKEIPPDPYDGQPLRYRRTNDGVVVYAIGPNGADDLGKIYRSGPSKDAAGKPLAFDLGIELFDPAKRVGANKP